MIGAMLELTKRFDIIQVSSSSIDQSYESNAKQLGPCTSEATATSRPCCANGSTWSTPGSRISGDRAQGTWLQLFSIKPTFHDVVDAIQLSWDIQRVEMQQAKIQECIAKYMIKNNVSNSRADLDLHEHEHKAIDRAITESGYGASLASMVRFTDDFRHRKLHFRDLPWLQFVLESPGLPRHNPIGPSSCLLFPISSGPPSLLDYRMSCLLLMLVPCLKLIFYQAN